MLFQLKVMVVLSAKCTAPALAAVTGADTHAFSHASDCPW